MVPSVTELEAAIAAVVEGDLTGLTTVLEADHPDLLHAAGNLAELTIMRTALTKVLQAWRDGGRSSRDVQKWASFVRRGFAAGRSSGPLRPIDIKYDAGAEALIVEIMARLDEIGDVVDGDIDDVELEEMVKTLEA
jgi:hypothetical protein